MPDERLIKKGRDDPVEQYLAIATSGAKPDDPRLAALLDMMSAEEIERARLALGIEILKREPIPSLPN